jgi:hypothetical protein
MAIHHRACNDKGLKFDSIGHTVQYSGAVTIAPYEIHVTPIEPDMFNNIVGFGSAEDPDVPESFGTWFIMSPGQQPVRPTGITWRGAYAGRFAPDGGWYQGGEGGDRSVYWVWKNGELLGPFPSGTNDIEGIANFTAGGPAGYTPVWQDRGKPITVDGYRLVKWTQAGTWLFGQQGGDYNDRCIAKAPNGTWYLVTNSTSPYYHCPKQQKDNSSLLVAWNGDQQSYLSSLSNWPVLSTGPAVAEPAPPSGPAVAVEDLWRGFGGFGHVPGVRTLESEGTFDIVEAPETIVSYSINVKPAVYLTRGQGRIVHPILGSFDYEAKPDEWVNLDQDIIIPPMWASSRGLTSTANALWQGLLKDVMVEERWKSLGGLAMPITQLRMLIAIWTMPLDPDVGYVQWRPNYVTDKAWKVLPVNLTVGGQGMTFDDVINYKDIDGNPIGWVTDPVTLQFKIVEPV